MQKVKGFDNWTVEAARTLTGYDLFPDDVTSEVLFDSLVV